MNINSSFINLSSSRFLAQAQRIVTALTANPAFPEPWPASVPTLAKLAADLASYEACLAAASAGDRNRIADRQAARQVLQGDLTLIAPYLQTMCQGDRVILGSTGFPLRRLTARSAVALAPPAPDNVVASRGTLSGTLSLSCRRIPGAGSYEVQVATADPTVEGNWSNAGTFKNCRSMIVAGLIPGKICSVRVRAIGSAGPGAWCAPSSLMVV